MESSGGVAGGALGGSARHIDAVLLDFFNTLAVRRSVDGWISDAEAQSEPLDAATRAEVAAQLPHVWSEARSMFPDANWDLDPASHRDVFMTVVCRSARVPSRFAAALYEAMPQQVTPNKGAAEFLRAVSWRGLKLAIVSNTALDIRPLLREWGLASLFNTVTLSFEVGCVKPDPRIFRLTAEALQVDPMRCVMIGDSPVEDGGAIAAGMQCLISQPSEMWRAFDEVVSQLSRETG